MELEAKMGMHHVFELSTIFAVVVDAVIESVRDGAPSELLMI